MGADWEQAAIAHMATTDDAAALLELVDAAIVIRTVNPALAAIFGLTPADLADQPAARLYPAEELADVTEKVRTTLAAGVPLTYEAVRELPERRLVVSGRMVPLDDHHVLAVATDVSREREAEHQLAQLEALADIGLWAWNVVDDVLVWSDNYRRLHGIGPGAEASVATALELVHPDDRPAVAAFTDELGTLGRARAIRYRILRPDGEVRHVEGRSEVVRGGAGDILRIVGTVQDVTEQQELEARERQVREATRRQAQAMELNDDIVQELSRAWLALELDDLATVRDVLEDTTRRVQDIVSGLLEATGGIAGEVEPGDLVRRRPAGGPGATG